MSLRERDIKDHKVLVRGEERSTTRVLYETLGIFASQQENEFTLDALASLLEVKPSTIQYRITEIRNLIEEKRGWNNARLLKTVDNGRFAPRYYVYSDPTQEIVLVGRVLLTAISA